MTSGVAAVATGATHACALTTAGGVKCWGGNAFGQLGDGTTIIRLTPVDVIGLTTGVVAITAAQSHTCAVTNGGGLKCWGSNSNGQLGDGTITQRATPFDVSGMTSGVIGVAAGNDALHTCALTSGGGVKCWGNNSNGQLGDGTTTQRTTPVAVSGLTSGVAALSTGSAHTCALTSSGGVMCWGDNSLGQVGDGTNTPRLTPVPVSGLAGGVAAITSGFLHTCALMTSGGAECWGFDVFGQLGDGATSSRSTPAAVSGLAHAVFAVSAGYDQTCAVTTDGGAQCWGSDQYGQLGTGRTFLRPAAEDVAGLTSGVAALAVGSDHGCVVTAAGGVQCWGQNYYGQLGDHTYSSRATPAGVSGLTSGIAAVTAGGFHSCALTGSGGLQCWGYNGDGELGDATIDTRSSPVGVVGLISGVAAVVAADLHTCALTSAGGVKCWGLNGSGQLGDGTTINRSTPVDVMGLTSGVVAVAVGPAADHSCAVTSAGALKCWGNNNNGQLGDGTTTDRATPVDVIGLTSGVVAAAAGGTHTCVLTTAGGVKCWGNNGAGQLGDGTTTQRLTPVDVIGLPCGVSGVTAGSTHTCARTSSGGATCWGANYGGQIGDGTLNDQHAPVDVIGLTSGVTAVAAGYAHTCAVTTAVSVKCWGNNKAGELGDGRPLQRSTPANVTGYGATVTVTDLVQFYDGTPKAVTVTTMPTGLVATVTYTGMNGTAYGPSTTAPSDVGTYSAFATVTDPNYAGSGSATAMLIIKTSTLMPSALVHLNVDGSSDAFLYNASMGDWYRENTAGGGGFSEASGGWAPGWSILSANFNADALTDMFVYSTTSGQWYKMLNDGTGFTTQASGGWWPGWQKYVTDLDGDGIDDIFLYDPASGVWYKCLSTPTGFTYIQGAWSAGWEIYPMKLNGDALGDLFLFNRSTGQWYWAVGTASGFTYPQTSAWAADWKLYPGDFNGDGLTDLLLQRTATGEYYVAMTTGSGFSYTPGQWSTGGTPSVVDLDGNGMSDVFLYDRTSGAWVELLGNGLGGFSQAGGGYWMPGWDLYPADFNGDSRTDWLLYNPTNGQYWQAWNLSNGSFSYFGGTWLSGLTIIAGPPIR
jgi:alpha-tubulin suppressor-like RCC1 family protein